jgi:hypothetical protein
MVVLTGFLLPTTALAGEGWVLKLQHTEAGMSQAEIRMEGDLIRASEEGMAQEVILGRDRMTVLDHNQKNFMVITYAQIEATLGPMMAIMKQSAERQRQSLLDAIDELEEGERAEVEAQLEEMGEGEGLRFEIEKSGKSEKVAGLPAERVLILEEGEPVAEVWVTGRISMDPVLRLAERFLPLVPTPSGGTSRYWDIADQLGGFPLKVVDRSAAEPRTLLLVTEASPVNFGEADWQPPAGYAESMMSLDSFGN